MYTRLDRSQPCPFPIPKTSTYLGEDANGYYWMDAVPMEDADGLGFLKGLGNMFKRMVKFTPKSFTPKNLMKAFTNTTVGVATGGLAYLAPAGLRKTIFKAGETIVPVVAAAAGAAALAPAVLPMLSGKLSAAGGLLGKSGSSVGGSLFQMLGSLTGSKQSEIASQVTPQDIVYAETHQGRYPQHIMDMISKAEREQFEYAAAQTANQIMNPLQRMLPPTETTHASSSLYPGLISQYEQAFAKAQQGQDGTDWSPVVTVGAVTGGVALLILLMRR